MSYFDATSREALRSGAKDLGVALSSEQLEQLDQFLGLVEAGNAKINLTRILGPEAVPLHLLDSLSVLATVDLKSGARVIDIGSGAGFPGIPLKIVRPDLDVVLLDSTAKRVKFLDQTILDLGLSGITTATGRAEDLARTADFRDKFDLAVCRALAKLEIASEYCLPYVKPGGHFIALKSTELTTELKAAQKIINVLGGGQPQTKAINLPGTDIIRTLVLIEKKGATPREYPRPNKQITREK